MRASMFDHDQDPAEAMLDSITMGQAYLKRAASSRIALDEQRLAIAGHAELRAMHDHAVMRTITELDAYMVEGAPVEVTAHATATATATATAKAPGASGVWAAVCLFWLAPALIWLADKTAPRYDDGSLGTNRWTDALDRAIDWCRDRADFVSVTVTEEATEHGSHTQTVYRTLCPHVGLIGSNNYSKHVRWVEREDPPWRTAREHPHELLDRIREAVADRDRNYNDVLYLTEREYADLAYAGHVPLHAIGGDPFEHYGADHVSLFGHNIASPGVNGCFRPVELPEEDGRE